MGETSFVEGIAAQIIKGELKIRHWTYKDMTDEMLEYFSIHELSAEQIKEIVEIFRRECRRDLINLVSIFRSSKGDN